MSTTASSAFFTALRPRLPDHCTPTSPLLETISSYTRVCIPTPLALTSCLLGNLSILAWLFAQLPQIIRNYRNQSTSGLSLSFLVEWNLGDLSNLFGAILTNQASWQIIIGAYYVFVDVSLVSQWVWYEWLKHGRPLRRIRFIRSKSHRQDNGTRQALEPYEPMNQQDPSGTDGLAGTSSPGAAARDIPTSKSSHAHNMFSTPVYGTMSPSTSLAASPADRVIYRFQQQTLPTASPRAVMFITLMIALASVQASPLSLQGHHDHESVAVYDLGTVLSWMSTFLYLVSRLPQLFMNYRRKSTAGLSPKMFAAAFLGNLFYSSSLASNPNAWYTFGPHGGHGWAGHEGSKQAVWVAAAMPFFLGAAGVLVLDGAVGVQFWLYGEGPPGHDDSVLVWQDSREAGAKEQAMHIRKVSGWMRGWQPTAAGKITPVIRVRRATVAGDEQPLLGPSDEREEASLPHRVSR